MGNQITYGSLEPGAQERAYEFLVNEEINQDSMNKLALDTDVGAEKTFIKLAEEWKPKTFTEFAEIKWKACQMGKETSTRSQPN